MQILCHCLKKGQISNPEDVARLCSVTYKNVFPVIVSIAVFSNVVNVIVLSYLHHSSTPNPARIYLLWLAVTHCLTCVPILVGIGKQGRRNVSFGWAFYFSHLEEPLYNALNFVCVYIIVGLSLDRYSAVCNAHKYTQVSGFRRAYIVAISAYAAAFIFYVPYCFYQRPQLDSDSVDEWHIGEGWLLNKPLWSVWAITVQIAHRIIPGVIMVAINVQIFGTVSKLQKQRENSSNKSTNSTRGHKDRQLLHLLLALTFTFLLTNIPSAVLRMVYIATPGHCNITYSEEIARAVSNCLEMSGYCFDFFFYFVMNTEYKRGLKTLIQNACKLFPCFKKDNSENNVSVTNTVNK